MMRMTSALVFVCASFLVGCAWGEGSPDEGGGGGGGVDAAVASATCGDSVCAPSEVGSCSQDCGTGGGATNPVCGNSTCETGETTASCPNDCGGGGGSGSGSGSGSATACPSDPIECFGCLLGGPCPAGHDAMSCQACALGGGGLPGGGGTCNNDGTCDQAEITDPTCADCI